MAFFLLVFSLFSFLPCGNGETQLPNHEDCRGGTHCKGGEQRRPICPAGFFCPEGNVTPVPCPPGMFRPAGAAVLSQGCLMCPVDFFNPRPGQKACLPCGSEAEQPEEGQETCVCLGKGRVFQPRDAQCTCPPGHQRSSGDGRHCVRQAYDVCRDSASRNQEGQCLTKKGWARYCSQKVCAAPRDYQGYDKVLGLCICHTHSLEGVCDSQCRRQQRDTLQFTCAGKRAQLLLTHGNGSKAAVFLEDLRTVLLRPYFSLKDVCASEQRKSTHPTHIVEMSGRGFLGVYNPDPQLFHNFIMLNEASSHHKANPPSARAADKSGHKELGVSWVQSLSPSNSTPQGIFTGILNPITCISVNVTILFVVSKEHYPVYDVNNLYNTNAEFDWGDFRSLGEEVREASQEFLLFLFQFQDPGTFVLRLSSNRHKRMYLRVMPLGGQCYEEGPFLPTTPRFAVQVGIARKRELLLKPDWAAIAGVSTGLLLLLVASVALTLLCQGLGWSQKGNTCPTFRRQQLHYNLDSYSSDIPRVFSIKKRHPSLQQQGRGAGNSCSPEGTACFPRRGGGWEPEEQIDLESFNTNVFFELLLRQSLSVTTTLGHFKEEVKILYQKLTSEMSALKNLWIKALRIPGKVEAESMGTEGYGKAKQQAEGEMQRRKELAAGYQESVSRQMQLLQQELEWQEENCVLFNSALREGVRLAETLSKEAAPEGHRPHDCTRLLARVEAAISTMSSVILEESHHLKAWGVLGEGTGAPLLNQDQTRTLSKQELVGSSGTAGAPDVVHMDPITGLLAPFPHCSLLLSSHCPGPVPSHHFLHPQTGKVLPLAGNVGYDPTRSRLVCAADSGSGGRLEPEVPIFPYIPYPVCPSTDLPVETKLPALCPEKTFSMGGLMWDPVTGMEVPVLGVTIHPDTGQRLAVGGTYLNPLTGTLAPLELWGPMMEPEGGKIVPILGVGLDGSTGEVLPLGGLVGPSGHLMLLGDSFTDPLSGKLCRVQGLHLQQGKVVPHSGGYQAVLEADWLLAQTRVLNTLKHLRASFLEGSCLAAGRLAALKAAAEEMEKAFAAKCYHTTHCLRSLGEKQEVAASVKSSGGKLGMIRYPGTEMWIPAVFGMQIPDPGGSSLMVPILGIDCDWNTGQPSPLAGTMEDTNGKGLVPITIGARTISPTTGEIGPVIGAQRNPWTHNVIPTVQSLGALPRRATDPDLLDFLEKEINSRHLYWHSRRKKEEGLLKKLNSLFLDALDAVKEGKAQQIQLKEKLEDIVEMCHFLKVSSLEEAERRTSKYFSSQVATEVSVLFKADRDEKEREIQVLLEVRKALEKLLELMEKMQLEKERIFLQLREGERHRSHVPGAEAAAKLRVRKLMLAQASECQEWILKQQASVETAHTKLEYLRDLSIIQAQQAKVLFSGSQQCFENYQTARFYGISGVSHGTHKEIQQKLIPLLKATVQVLEENNKSSASPETPGYSSRSTLKASAAPTEPLRAEESQESTSASIIFPVLPSSPSERISHMQQEVQRRFLLEKHACELAHLELSLMTEEINALCSFWDSQAEGKEHPEGSQGLKSRKGTEATVSKDSLLKDLSEHHHHAEQALCQRQLQEIKHLGLSPDLAVPKQPLHFLEEIPQQLSLCLPALQTPHSEFPEQQKQHSREIQHSPDSVTQMLQVSAVKIVKLEALRQMCLYRVLDLYCNLQILSCPEGVTRILGASDQKNNGEEVAQEVAQSREEQQVARAVAFLQEHHREGDLLKGLNTESEAELRKMQAGFRLELQTQTEEKVQQLKHLPCQIKTKETQILQETKGGKFGNLMAYSILSQRHLRETVTLLQDSSRLKKVASRCQKEGTGLEHLVGEDLSVDGDTKDVLHLLQDNSEHVFLVLEFIQTVRLLQLRERHFKEMVCSIRGSEKFVDEANLIINEVRKFREQKMRRLKEELKASLKNRGTKKSISSSFDPLQIRITTSKRKETREKRQGQCQASQEEHLALRAAPIWASAAEGAELQDQLLPGEQRRRRRKPWRLQQDEDSTEEHSERKAFSGKGFHPDLQELRRMLGRDRKEKKQPDSSSASSITQPLRAPGIHQKAEDQLLCFLTKNIKVLKQAEHVMASRMVLLNPQLPTSPLCGADGPKCAKTSFLLALLKEVNEELRSHAVAAGLVQSQSLAQAAAASTLQHPQSTEDASRTWEGEPAAVDAAALSARELVIYQYGISILQFLRLHINTPEITLGVASSLPPSDATGNAFRGSFFYQNSKNKLFILRDCLSSVGGFLLLLVHCLAHVSAAELSYDTNPLFLRLFYQGLKACLSEMFSLRLQLSAAPQGDKSQGLSQVLLKEEPFSKEEVNLISQLLEVKVKRPTDMEAFEKHMKNNLLLHMKSEEPLHDKWLVEKKEHGKNSLGGRACFEEETCPSSSLSELEDKVDVLTEELVQIIEDEHQFLSSKGNENLLCYYLEITSLEKDCLVKQINALEEEIAVGRKL